MHSWHSCFFYVRFVLILKVLNEKETERQNVRKKGRKKERREKRKKGKK